MTNGITDYLTFEGAVEPMEWGTATYTVHRIPPIIVTALGKTKRVKGEINDHPVNLALTKAPVIDGVFVWTGKSLLREIGIEPGERVEVLLRPAPDDAVDVPSDVTNALLAAGLSNNWDRLTPGKRRGLLYSVNSAKRLQTRLKRIDKLVDEVRTL